MAKAIFPLLIEAEERRFEQKIGFGTHLSLTVNYEW